MKRSPGGELMGRDLPTPISLKSKILYIQENYRTSEIKDPVDEGKRY